MRTITDDQFWKILAFDTPAFTQERLLIEVTTLSAIADDTLYLICGNVTAEYYLPYNTPLTIDVSELVRMNNSGTIYLRCGNAQDEPIVWTHGGLIHPHSQIIPKSPNDFTPLLTSNQTAPILLPTLMLSSPFVSEDNETTSVINQAEIFLDATNDNAKAYEVTEVKIGNFNPIIQRTEITPNALRFISTWTNYKTTAPITTHKHYIDVVSNSNVLLKRHTWKEKSLDCDKLYACVQWISRSGTVKRHTWEVRKITDNVVNTFDLETIDNSYNQHKGQEVALQLVLEGLNKYDLWYYSDIVTSNDVRVTFSLADYDAVTNTIAEKCRVQVSDKKIQQLDGNAGNLSTLSVNVNFRRYDTI